MDKRKYLVIILSVIVVSLVIFIGFKLMSNDSSSKKNSTSETTTNGVVDNYNHENAIKAIVETNLVPSDVSKLTIGMKLDAVNTTLNEEGKLFSEYDNKKVYDYSAEDGYKLQVYFTDDKLSGISLIK